MVRGRKIKKIMKNLILFENFSTKEPLPITKDKLEAIISRSGKTPFLVSVVGSIDPDSIIGKNEWKYPGSVSMASVNDLSKILNREIIMSPSGYSVRERPIVVLVSQRDLSRLPESILQNCYTFLTDRDLYGVITNGLDYYFLS